MAGAVGEKTWMVRVLLPSNRCPLRIRNWANYMGNPEDGVEGSKWLCNGPELQPCFEETCRQRARKPKKG